MQKLMSMSSYIREHNDSVLGCEYWNIFATEGSSNFIQVNK